MFDAVPEGTEFVLPSYRDAGKNFRTRLMRIIKRSGLKPWPKLFHNLRASCQTELEDRFPGHVVCAWLGNSEAVARKHYLQVTDEHFERATTESAAYALQSCAESGGMAEAKNPKNPPFCRVRRVRGWAMRDSNICPVSRHFLRFNFKARRNARRSDPISIVSRKTAEYEIAGGILGV